MGRMREGALRRESTWNLARWPGSRRITLSPSLVTWVCGGLPRELALDQETLPHVGHLDHQAQLPVLLGDETAQWLNLMVSARFLGHQQFWPEGARDEDLNQGGDDQLGLHQEEDGMRAFLSNGADSIADGGLGFQGKQECPGGESTHDAWGVIGRGLTGLQVPMDKAMA